MNPTRYTREQKNYFIIFGKRLREFREKKNITRTELSEKTGLKISRLTDIERGKVRPSQEIVAALRNSNMLSANEIKILSEYIVPPLRMQTTASPDEKITTPESKPTAEKENVPVNVEKTEENKTVSANENTRKNDKTDFVENKNIESPKIVSIDIHTLEMLSERPYLINMIKKAYKYGLSEKQCKKLIKKMKPKKEE